MYQSYNHWELQSFKQLIKHFECIKATTIETCNQIHFMIEIYNQLVI